jgi:hypothetical protein
MQPCGQGRFLAERVAALQGAHECVVEDVLGVLRADIPRRHRTEPSMRLLVRGPPGERSPPASIGRWIGSHGSRAVMHRRSLSPVCSLNRAHLDPARGAISAVVVRGVVEWAQPIGELDQHLT